MTQEAGGRKLSVRPSGWQDWQQWVQDVDWSDWRSWLRRVAGADWAAGPWPGAPWGQVAQAGELSLTLTAFGEDEPGDRIAEHLSTVWPAFRQWWRESGNTRPTAAEAQARLEEHMPELVPAWQRLAAMLGDPDAAAALALWNPPPFLTGCSQAVVSSGGPALIRNYDWDYRLFEAVVARTGYGGRRVLGMLDCMWGLLDGVNDAGLAASLTFGGRPQVGEGFGIPLVIRYVLQTCRTADEAVQTLRRVPVHMSYNVTVADRDGQHATVYLAPDRPARVTSLAVSTNYQGTVEWAPYAEAIRTVERQEHLEELVAAGTDAPGIIEACLRPPLYATRFDAGFGTLYTAEYRPAEGEVTYHWPESTWNQSLGNLHPGTIEVPLSPSRDMAG
jgi:predicted choloylglycine hydrolase